MENKKRTVMNECYSCTHKGNISGDCHISCFNPDPDMEGDPCGVVSGWFYYPIYFDPVWKMVSCKNYEEKKEN